MNWRAGFKRIEIIYAVIALLFILLGSFNAGGGYNGLGDAWSSLTNPQDQWNLYDPSDPEGEIISVPHGKDEAWVRAMLIRNHDFANGASISLRQQGDFHWDAARELAWQTALFFGVVWLIVKASLWIFRGFRQPKA